MNFNNNLLNQTYQNNMNNLNMFNRNSQNINQSQMMHMYQTMSNLKKMQQSQIISKINELERNKDKLHLDKDELRNAIIRPIKIEKSDKQEVVIKYKDLEKNFNKKELENLWNKRTNQAYKNIIKDDRFLKKDYKKKEDLIVHKVTDLDKLGVDEELKDFEGKIESQNGELKIQYSQSKELEHKKKFEYNNKYKYATKYNPKAHEDLKEDNVEFFKQEQEKIEKDKKKIDDIIQSLITSNILSEQEKKDLEDLQEDEKQEKITKITNETKELKEDIKSPEKKQIKITIKSKKIESNLNSNNDNDNDNDSEKKVKLETGVDDEIRNKYLNRKKK